jgi:hypothetical protein
MEILKENTKSKRNIKINCSRKMNKSMYDKIKKTPPLVLLIPLLAGSCATEQYYISYDYNFMHESNNVLIYGEGGTVPNPYVLVGETEFHFDFLTMGGHAHSPRQGGEYSLSVSVKPRNSLVKSVKTITLNRITIRAGDNEFNMIEKIYYINPNLITKAGLYVFNWREIDEVQTTGIIDIEALKKKLGLPNGTETWSIFMCFRKIPIDYNYTRYRMIRLRLDITVEYITGERARLDRDLIGILDKKIIPIYTRWWTV